MDEKISLDARNMKRGITDAISRYKLTLNSLLNVKILINFKYFMLKYNLEFACTYECYRY